MNTNRKRGLIGKDLANWHPNVFALDGMIEKLFSLPLGGICPVAFKPVVHPRPLNIDSRCSLDKLAAFGRAKVPHRLHVMMLSEILAEVITVARDDVDHTTGQIRCVEHLQKEERISTHNQKRIGVLTKEVGSWRKSIGTHAKKNEKYALAGAHKHTHTCAHT